MKLGILTFHKSINYGAFMQCYALSQRLQRDFPQIEVEVIDYNPPEAIYAEEKKVNAAADPVKRDAYRKRQALFSECCARLPLSAKQLHGVDQDTLFRYLNDTYDIVVVGSDAVWNWNVRGFANAYFLRDYHGMKLSYAASVHGQDFRTMTQEQRAWLAEAFREFAYLGVRDVSTEQMLQMVDSQLIPHHNCDPTLLLDIASLPCDRAAVRDKLREKGIDPDGILVAVMAGEYTVGRDWKQALHGKAQTIALYEPNSYADAYMDQLDPFEWATVFSFCRGTVTHFFHGTLLSLVNGIPPMATEPSQGFAANYTSKIRDILTRLELMDYYRPIPMDRLSKLRRKLGLSVNRPIWKKIAGDLEHIFSAREETYSMIRRKVEREAESYLDFKAALERCIQSLNAKEKT